MPPGIGYSTMPAWASTGLTPGNVFGNPARRRMRPPQPPFLGFLRGDAGIRPFAPPGLGYVPSAQRFNRLAPSERAGAFGYFENELGLHAPDVEFLMNKLRPRGAITSRPRWVL